MEEYKLVFTGKLVDGFSAVDVKTALEKELKVSPKTIDLLFKTRNKKIVIKKFFDLDLASEFSAAYKKAGLHLDLISSEKNLSLEAVSLPVSPAIREQSVVQEPEGENSLCNENEGDSVIHSIYARLIATIKTPFFIALIGLIFIYLYFPSPDVWIKKGFVIGIMILLLSSVRKM